MKDSGQEVPLYTLLLYPRSGPCSSGNTGLCSCQFTTAKRETYRMLTHIFVLELIEHDTRAKYDPATRVPKVMDTFGDLAALFDAVALDATDHLEAVKQVLCISGLVWAPLMTLK